MHKPESEILLFRIQESNIKAVYTYDLSTTKQTKITSLTETKLEQFNYKIH